MLDAFDEPRVGTDHRPDFAPSKPPPLYGRGHHQPKDLDARVRSDLLEESMNRRVLTAVLTAALVAGGVGVAQYQTSTTRAAAVSGVGGTIEAITPVRLLDTRTTNGGHNAPFAAGETFDLQVLGRGAVPSFGVAAVQINITVIPGSGGGYLTIWPSGVTRPTASNINFAPNANPIANTALVGIGANGMISIYSYPANTHVVIDVQGWVAAAMAEGAGPSVPFDQTPLSAPDSVKARQILSNAIEYALGPWWSGPAQTLLVEPLDQDVPNDAVRRLSMEALALATGAATGGFQRDQYTAAERADTLIRRVASQHLVNTPGGWGDSWQSPMNAGIVGRAAWLLWNRAELAPDTKQYVARMIEHEANYAARYKLKYLRNAAGTLLSPGDSGAEEVSWTAMAMQVAVVMLPTNQHAQIWAKEVAQFALAAWARPQDVASATTVNGIAISSWIKGSNVETDGTVVNHSRIASDYSTTTYQNLDGAFMFTLAGQPIPRALTAFLGPVYAAFRDVTFVGGGQTYVAGTGDIYYPEGNDWGTGQKLPYALSDAQALVFGYDPGWAAQYLDLHLDAQLAMQARFTDGHTYLDDTEYNYMGREEHVAQLASQLYLTLYLRDHGLVSFTDTSYWI